MVVSRGAESGYLEKRLKARMCCGFLWAFLVSFVASERGDLLLDLDVPLQLEQLADTVIE